MKEQPAKSMMLMQRFILTLLLILVVTHAQEDAAISRDQWLVLANGVVSSVHETELSAREAASLQKLALPDGYVAYTLQKTTPMELEAEPLIAEMGTSDPVEPESAGPEPMAAFCFSGDMKVQVKDDKGWLLMKDLKMGDEVLVDHDTYERVYAFGHRDDHATATFLHFLPSNLHLSENHMVFVKGKGAIPASMVQVGDQWMHTGATIKDIRTTTKKGVYAPFTPSGKIVVNSVLASTYVSFQGSNVLMLGSFNTRLSYQWLAHSMLTPIRWWCLVLFKDGWQYESYYQLALAFLGQHPLLLGFELMLMLPLLCVFSVLDLILRHSTVVGIIVLTMLVLNARVGRRRIAWLWVRLQPSKSPAR